MMSRDEHLAQCKQRALEYLDRSDVSNAITSMLSDLRDHPDTAGVGEKLSPLGIMYILNQDEAGARSFIEGFR